MMRRTMRLTRRPDVCTGVTLIELVVTLALLGLLAGVVGLAYRQPRPVAPADESAARVAAARAAALATARPVSISVPMAGRAYSATAYPDGTVLADSAVHVDVLTGRVRRAVR